MSVSITLPQMGESVVEGTIIRWLKQEGETVAEDEPIVEVSTDKIDTEIPSPAAGTLSKILVGPDETVAVGTELAVIEAPGEDGGAPAKTVEPEAKGKHAEPEATKEAPAPKAEPSPPAKQEPEPPAKSEPEPKAEPAAAQPAEQGNGQAAQRAPAPSGQAAAPAGAVLSPLVRKLARESGVDLSSVRGTGSGGRITKDDVLAAASAPSAPARAAAPAARRRPEPAPIVAAPTEATQDVSFSRIRKAIAEHMSRSRKTAAHVTNVVEVDMTRVAQLRNAAKEEFKGTEGFSLTFLPFIASAVIQAIRVFPEFNAHLLEDGGTARLYRAVNLGIAVGRDEGLIVPVVKGADGMNLVGLARAINDVGTRARTKGGLRPEDVADGTFTITNNGGNGTLFETPIINQPQAAILGTGAVEKRPAVITVDGADAIAVRSMMFLCLSYDHRWIDGHRAALFNSKIKEILEDADFEHELGL